MSTKSKQTFMLTLAGSILFALLLVLHGRTPAARPDPAAKMAADWDAANAQRAAENDALRQRNEQLRQEIRALGGKPKS